MQVKDIMSKHPDALSDDMTLKQAAEEMQKHDFGFLPVKHNGQIVGVVTDRDLVIRALAKGQDPNKTQLKDTMTNKILFCHEEDDLNTAAQMMCDKQIHRLAVYDKKNQFTGVISIGDIARKAKDNTLLAKLTESIHQK